MPEPGIFPAPMHDLTRGGTLAFLFTDIEGSTERWERAPEVMRVALARHDGMLRKAISRSGGQVFKTVGDAFCAAFSSASDALAAALAAQRALEADGFAEIGGLKVRMAVHAGAVEARDGDYFGQPLNRVARLLAAGHGGQVLVSAVAADLARGSLPAGSSLVGLGAHRLKDFAEPQEIYQLVAPDLASEFPPLRSLAAILNNLPQQVTSFIGRETEMAEIKALLEKHRLVTLVGSGGVGKTRISLQSRRRPPRPVSGRRLACRAGAADGPAAHRGEHHRAFSASQSARAGAPRRCRRSSSVKSRALLILDNCEHLVAAVAHLAEAIIRKCPNVSILASSREPLAIAGETHLPHAILSFPDRPEGITAEAALGYSAVRLFAERASAGCRRFCGCRTTMRQRSRKSADGSTAWRSRSSWPRRGSRC